MNLDFEFIKRGRGHVLLYNGYQFYKNCNIKTGSYWRCKDYKNSVKCKGYVIVSKPMAKMGGSLMQSYYLYAAILALKLLALVPLASIVCNPDKVQRANLSDLKHLTPFWLVAALYVTTSPDQNTAINLMRAFVAARFVAAIGYVTKIPKHAVEAAFFLSFGITSFMAGWVIYSYRNAI